MAISQLFAPCVRQATLLIKIQELQSQLAQSTSAAAIFITETKLIDNASMLRCRIMVIVIVLVVTILMLSALLNSCVTTHVFVYAPDIRHTHTTRDTLLSWNDTLSFPMLVKNDQTGERNVLCLKNLEAENVPDVSPV